MMYKSKKKHVHHIEKQQVYLNHLKIQKNTRMYLMIHERNYEILTNENVYV